MINKKYFPPEYPLSCVVRYRYPGHPCITKFFKSLDSALDFMKFCNLEELEYLGFEYNSYDFYDFMEVRNNE